MTEITVSDLINHCNCKLLIGDENTIIKECFINSKMKTNGGTFFGINGKKTDGSLFYKEAFNNGANVCVLSKIYDLDLKGYDNKTVVISKDPLIALQTLAKYKRSLFNGKVIGITGSIGKTSTKEMIAKTFEKKYKVLKTIGNENGQLGVPLSILRHTNEDVMVLEMGVSMKGEMNTLVSIAKPNISVITNVLLSHVENFGSKYDIFKEKIGIASFLEDGVLVLNNDDEILNEFAINDHMIYKITVGQEKESDFMSSNVREGMETYFDCLDIKDLKVMGGKEFITNALISIAVSKLLEIPDDDIKDAINNFKNVNHRLEIINLNNNVTLIDDSYNSNYESIKSAIGLLSKFKRRKIAILGDVLELGKESKKIHKKIGKEIINGNVDYLITIGKRSRLISKEAKKLGFKRRQTKHFKSEIKSRKYLKKLIKSEDAILIKGSHGIGLVNLVNYLKEGLVF